MEELRISDTNSANDSKGRAFGLEGNSFIYVTIGLVIAIAFYLLLSVLFGISAFASFCVAMPFFIGPIAWTLLFKHNRPDGFAEDWFDQTFGGEGWSFAAHVQSASPLNSKHGNGS